MVKHLLWVNVVVLISGTFAAAQSYRTSLKNFEVLRITSKTHHDSVILKELSLAHNSFPLGPHSTCRECIKESVITFHILNLQLVNEEFEASECRVNTKDSYYAIINPIPHIHLKIHEDITKQYPSYFKEIEDRIIKKVEDFPTLDLEFYDFENLNYFLECPIDYFEIGQIKLKQVSLEATLEKNVKMASSCGFSVSDSEFDGSITTSVSLKIPLNGSFHCVNGRTSTCKRSIAQVSNARYRLLED